MTGPFAKPNCCRQLPRPVARLWARDQGLLLCRLKRSRYRRQRSFPHGFAAPQRCATELQFLSLRNPRHIERTQLDFTGNCRLSSVLIISVPPLRGHRLRPRSRGRHCKESRCMPAPLGGDTVSVKFCFHTPFTEFIFQSPNRLRSSVLLSSHTAMAAALFSTRRPPRLRLPESGQRTYAPSVRLLSLRP